MKELEKKLRQARPRLSDAAPLTHRIVQGFIVFNLWIALTLYEQSTNSLLTLPIVTPFFNKNFWGVIFVLLAVGLMYGIRRNSWGVIRDWMLVAVFIKTIWLYGLVFVALKYGINNQLGVIGLWTFAAWVQIVTVAYFIPGKFLGWRRWKDERFD